MVCSVRLWVFLSSPPTLTSHLVERSSGTEAQWWHWYRGSRVKKKYFLLAWRSPNYIYFGTLNMNLFLIVCWIWPLFLFIIICEIPNRFSWWFFVLFEFNLFMSLPMWKLPCILNSFLELVPRIHQYLQICLCSACAGDRVPQRSRIPFLPTRRVWKEESPAECSQII